MIVHEQLTLELDDGLDFGEWVRSLPLAPGGEVSDEPPAEPAEEAREV